MEAILLLIIALAIPACHKYLVWLGWFIAAGLVLIVLESVSKNQNKGK
jgi:hypothetical protein